MDRIPEADWKVFKKHHGAVRDAFSRRAIAKLRELLDDKNVTSIEQYQLITEYVYKVSKEEDRLFHDYRRSSAILFVRAFHLEGLLSDEQVSEYSDEVKRRLGV